MPEINAVNGIHPCVYGHRMRSPLEARWSIALSGDGIEWEYEPQIFELDCGRIAPTFWIPSFHIWLFVKEGSRKSIGANDELELELQEVKSFHQLGLSTGAGMLVVAGDLKSSAKQKLYFSSLPALDNSVFLVEKLMPYLSSYDIAKIRDMRSGSYGQIGLNVSTDSIVTSQAIQVALRAPIRMNDISRFDELISVLRDVGVVQSDVALKRLLQALEKSLDPSCVDSLRSAINRII